MYICKHNSLKVHVYCYPLLPVAALRTGTGTYRNWDFQPSIQWYNMAK